jgi:hypothetical protein
MTKKGTKWLKLRLKDLFSTNLQVKSQETLLALLLKLKTLRLIVFTSILPQLLKVQKLF